VAVRRHFPDRLAILGKRVLQSLLRDTHAIYQRRLPGPRVIRVSISVLLLRLLLLGSGSAASSNFT
jgi:hypothetical protein